MITGWRQAGKPGWAHTLPKYPPPSSGPYSQLEKSVLGVGDGGWKKVDSNIAKKIVNLKRAIKYSTKIQDEKYDRDSLINTVKDDLVSR